MAEKLTAKKRKEDLNRLFAEYNRRLGMLYGSYVRKLLALGYSEDVLESDALFNFDNFPLLKARLEDIFNDYFQNSMLCYKSGITSGVSLAYAHDNDAIGQFSVLTDKALETARKTAAATFIANRLNSKIGLNLAQSVWNYCQQTKAEFEMAMSNVIADGLGKGESAEEVGRRIRQYLNNPDMMYRRYHTVKVLKNGQKKDIVTWRRKRIIDGRVRFVEEPLEHVGLGVYRSARKNALRVARTEINAAYHTARNERWANEPFVIGQHIHVSPQHDPEEDADICDELEGYYPKGFVWNGWHPQCYAEGTQVLTTKGWKEFKDVTTQDIVYSLNPQTREIEETSIVGVQKYPYNGELIHFFNRSLECLVTPEHQMVYISKSGAHEIKKCNATEYKPSMGAFYRSAVNTAKDRTNIMFGDKNIPFDVYCEFMGYYLADGSMQHDYGIVLSQEKGQPAWKRMQTCIKKMGFTPHVYKSTIVLYHRAFGQELLKYGTAHYKYIPQEILNASKRQIQIFLDAYIVCDGHIKKPRPFMGNRGHVCTPNHGERMYFTSSPQMAAEIGLLLLKVGHRPSYRIMSPKNTVKKDGTVIKQRYDCYRISECDSATATVFNKEKVEYIGFVYDVTLENNHIMYIQKDGKCFWGSNCMCTSDPVMISGEERKDFYKRLFKGEDMSNYVSPNRIKDMPDQYKRYIEDNADKIVDAYKRDKLAWHLASNKSYWIKYLNATQRKQMGADAMSRREAIQEIAKARHAKRDAESIKRRAEQRQRRLATERAYVHYGESVLRYMNGIKDVDTSALKTALEARDYVNIYEEAKALKEQGKKILSLSRLENPILVARNYSMSEAIAINKAIEARLARESVELLPRKRFLESEIKWVEEHKKYDTWKVAQDAYKKELRIVERKIDIKAVADSVSDALAYATLSKSRKIKELASEINHILTRRNVDLDLAKSKAQEINRKYQQLLKNKLKSPKLLKETAVNHETIEDLKKRLGTKFPKTLEYLEDAISEYEKNSRYYGVTAKTHKNEIELLMQKVFSEHDLGMNIKDSILEKVLNSKFMNTFETGSSGGYLGSTSTTGKISPTHSRLSAAHKMFGLPRKDLAVQQLDRKEYEKYGNLLDHNILRSMQNNTARSYGNVEVRFKKDKVVATWTAGDSLGVRYQPSLVSDPKACSFDDFYNTPTSIDIQTTNLVEFKKEHISSYLELQYHGQLTIDCIESITYPYDILDGSHDKILKIAKEFKKKGASIYYIKGNALFEL